MTEFYIIDLRPEWNWRPYVTLWNPKNAGYCYSIPWAGRYSQEQVNEQRSYYLKRGPRCYFRFPVPCDAISHLLVDPEPGIIDGNVGPVLRNDGKTRNALRRLKYIYPGMTLEEVAA